MFKIRDSQIRALEEAMNRQFLEALARRLRRKHPEALGRAPPKALLKATAQAAALARSHGASWQSAIALFVEIQLTVGSGFERHPRIRTFLDDPALPADRRILELGKKISPKAWKQIRSELRRSSTSGA